MKKAEYLELQSFLQRDSAEHEGHAEVQSVGDQQDRGRFSVFVLKVRFILAN